MSDDFFSSQEKHSNIKTQIMVKYFKSWAKIILNQEYVDKAAYIDLFCGPGRYDDGSESTPILILKEIINNKQYRNNIKTYFSDKNKEKTKKLKKEINRIPNINMLKYSPVVKCQEANKKIISKLKKKTIPALVFLDPWGYKELSLDLIDHHLEGWGCDIIAFFNYSRINRHLNINKEDIKKNIYSLFGKKQADKLMNKINQNNFSPYKREELIFTTFEEALRKKINCHVARIKFETFKGNRTSHYILGITKNPNAHEIMKEIMIRESNDKENLAVKKDYNNNQMAMFNLKTNDLKKELLKKFKGRKMKVGDIISIHHPNTDYIKKDYKKALKQLEKEEKISCNPPKEKRPADTMADPTSIEFPE